MSELSIKFKCRKEDFVKAVEKYCHIKDVVLDGQSDLAGAACALLQSVDSSALIMSKKNYMEVDKNGCIVLNNEELALKFRVKDDYCNTDRHHFISGVEEIQKMISLRE